MNKSHFRKKITKHKICKSSSLVDIYENTNVCIDEVFETIANNFFMNFQII